MSGKWEHKIIRLSSDIGSAHDQMVSFALAELTIEGYDGWELVTVLAYGEGALAFMKRPV